MTNIKAFVVRGHRRHPGGDNNSTFLLTADLKLTDYVSPDTLQSL